jgi:flavin reductase (DIM6/NTAB) family NADH-FMN oxidoreductase RutF
VDPEIKQTVLRQFTYGLYGVTTHRGNELNAMLANFLVQASFDPPLVVVSVERDSKTLAFIRASQTFGVNVLKTGQREFAGLLGKASKRNPTLDKLANVRFHLSAEGNPIFDDALGFVECRVLSETPAGDSVVIVGEVVDAQLRGEGEALTLKETGFKHAG